MYGLIGKKLEHSYSKVIHEKLSNEKYNLIELNELDSFFHEKEFKGINITIPYKNDVIPYCDKLSETATRTHSVNSIVNIEGKLHGYNTDYDGLLFMLKHNNITIKNKRVLILGNGSTSRTIKVLCSDLNAANIIVSARNPKEEEIDFQSVKIHQNIDVIFNTTPVGMYPSNDNSLEIDLDNFKNLDAVVDLIYNPLETKILNSARKRNIKSINGLLMLVHQAVKTSEIFHNVKHKDEVTLNLYKSILLDVVNFVLIGMPMSGKSYFANLLANNYDKQLVDIDKLIESNEHQSISSIFQTKGEKAFRSIETQNIIETSKQHNLAISVGGGAILDKKNIDYLKQNGIIIFLDVSLEMLKTFNPKNRPLLKDKNNIERLYNDRYNLYNQYADIIVIKDSYNEIETLHKIEVKLNEYINS